MIDKEGFKCSKCGEEHFAFYATMMIGYDFSQILDIESEPMHCLLLSGEFAYIQSDLEILILDRGKSIILRVWSKVNRTTWKEYIENLKNGKSIMVESEIIGEIPLYPEKHTILCEFRFDKEKDIFVMICKEGGSLSQHQQNGINFEQYSLLLEEMFHNQLSTTGNTDKIYKYEDLEKVISYLQEDLNNQFIHVRYENEVIFQIVSVLFTELHNDDSSKNEICIDIPVDTNNDQDFAGEALRYLDFKGYNISNLDGIKIYQLNLGEGLTKIRSEIKELCTAVFNIPYSKIDFSISLTKKIESNL